MSSRFSPSPVCVTLGHEEHFLDVPNVVRKNGARVVATPAVCKFLSRRNDVPSNQLLPTEHGDTLRIDGLASVCFRGSTVT